MEATKKNQKAIAALRQAADAIDKGVVVYDWSDMPSCPVGVFTCALLGVSQWWLRERVRNYKNGDDWSTYVKRHSTVGGGLHNKETALAEVLEAMPADELEKLEYLEDEEVAWRAAVEHLKWPSWRLFLVDCFAFSMLNRERASHAAAYMRALADKMEGN